MIRIILIRHGLTAWNVGQGQVPRLRGTIDLPLAAEGLAQAEITSRRLAARPLAAIYASPLQRATRTAETIAEPHGLPVQTLPGLTSMDYGAWAGKTRPQVAREWPDLLDQWFHDPFGIQIPGGERPQALRRRALDALYECLARRDGDSVAIVSHQIILKSLICTLMELPSTAHWRYRQDLCNLTEFDYDPAGDRFTLAGLNDTCHLDPALPRADGNGTRIVLVRHGQTAWNAGAGPERFRGRMDLPLDEVGQAQARAVAGRLKHEPVAAIYCSPLLRTQQTAAPLAKELGLAVQPHEGLLDIDYGRLQGLTGPEAAQAYPELFDLWLTTPGRAHFPGGEGLTGVQARLLSFLEELVARHPGQTVVLVGHQIVNKVLTCTLLWQARTLLWQTHSIMPATALDQVWRIGQDTTGIDVFQQVQGMWRTLCLNDTCHLA